MPAALMAGLAVVGFYLSFAVAARQLVREHGLPMAQHNSIKHALAAGRTYQALRRLQLPPDSAEAAVLALGTVNEYAEHHLTNHDDTREMMKDFQNNQSGLTAARWREDRADAPALPALILALVQAEVLVVNREDVTAPAGADPAYAAHWAAQHQAATRARVEAMLDGRTPPILLDR